MTTWDESYVSINGIRLHYYRTGGKKPSIILAHGVTDNGLGWTRLAKALEAQFDLIMFDARGHGLSDKPTQGYGAEQQARDLAELIRVLELQKPAVIGHSMGAVVATILADRHPDDVSRLVLEDPAWYPRDEDITQEEINEHAREWAEAIANRKTQSVEAIIEKIRLDHPTWDAEEIATLAQAKLQVTPHVTEYDIIPYKPWWEIVPNIKCPVLLITGDAEGKVAISPTMAEEIKSLNPDFQISRLSDAGHNVRRDNFHQYVTVVQEFLNT